MRLRRAPSLRTPSLDHPWREVEYCVLDLETTGLDLRNTEIVSYGYTIVRNGRILCGSTYYSRVQPRCAVSVPAVSVHGLRAVDLDDAPLLQDEIDTLVSALDGRVLVAHAAWIERAFLNRAVESRKMRLSPAVIDTAALIRAAGLDLSPAGYEPNIETVAGLLRLPVHTPHHALGDAFTTAQIFIAVAARFDAHQASELRCEDLARLGRT